MDIKFETTPTLFGAFHIVMLIVAVVLLIGFVFLLSGMCRKLRSI